ncbi:MAG: hypothetical protein HC769_22225 [Cyanobacteria bacterium CRU_2_1]|nr:hypothetical protein [Cyanobacteria bacterium RU_5_0]NJR61307.1 hypothetical protein [Cyanobacteria bacterium CRU_2_1]
MTRRSKHSSEHPSERQSKRQKDVRISATSIIWGCATGMLAICIPLTNNSDQSHQGTIIPLAVLVAATVGTVAVWRSSPNPDFQPIEESNQVRELKQRIADLETIASVGELEWQRRIQSTVKSELPMRDRLDDTER